MQNDTFLIVDFTNIVRRAIYTSWDTAFSMTSRLIHAVNPSHLLLAYDNGEHNWRSDILPDYKGTRADKDEATKALMPIIRTAIEQSMLPIVSCPEADDAIAYYAEASKMPVIVASQDKDLWALASDNVSILWWKQSFATDTILTPKDIADKLVHPSLIRDYKALSGDAGDNIPGVAGIGNVRATALLSEYGSIAGVYNNLEKIGGSLARKLASGRESARISWQVAGFRRPQECFREVSAFSVNHLDLQAELNYARGVARIYADKAGV